DCSSGWTAYGKHCYKVFDEPKTWEDAEKFCSEQANGGHLVSFRSSKEADFVVTLTAQTKESEIVWMGLSKIWNQCDWGWTNGAKLNYEAWAEAESYCVWFSSTNKEWKSRPCSLFGHFVCKSPAW
uniref:Snaclec coagulation factor IX/factor X-binding protein subunit B n=1 Tax=Echis carinatus TaxID=40353 RepID=SL9B_ECHCA|nr:RecName: Full=Snaclec coagulation factor IX/factor X-binding protein subunit B; Short=IX/X-BP subunit B; AltName: Full=ECLV IX/X-BP subunit B [Echis carinatus]AAB36402.1 ECLV IX/X-bp beta subunit=Ca(2+)-dependent coagulation factor IX/factor X-binding protein beta subunit [Echis carinatus=saw-scaled or carpet vipers, ssp. leucogaster, venom, Peptide, 125 aa] [Echis carinatus]